MLKEFVIKAEIQKWLSAGYITPEQAKEILGSYDYDKRSLVSVVAIMGAILVGTGILLFIASNWSGLTWIVKLAILFVLLSGIYYSGFRLQDHYPRVTYGIYGIGAFAYGAAIWLIAQAFNFPIDTRLAFFLWFLGLILPFFYLANSITGLVALFSLNAWFFTGGRAGYPEILLFSLLVGLIFFFYARREKSPLFYHLSFFSWAAAGCYLNYRVIKEFLDYGDGSYILFPLLVFSMFYLLLSAKTKESTLSGSLLSAGVIILLIASYFFSFNFIYDSQRIAYYPIIYTLLILALSSTLIWLKEINPWLRNYILLIGGVSLAILWIPNRDVLLLLTNTNLFLQNLVIIFFAFQMRNTFLFNLGVLSFGLSVLIKYFDYFYDMLPRSFFFIVMGLLMVGLSILLERNRKKYLQKMEAGHENL